MLIFKRLRSSRLSLFCIALLIGVFAISTVPATIQASTTTTFSVGSAHGQVGDTVTIDVKADYTGSAFNFDVLYDKDVLQPTVLSNGKASVTAMSQLVGPEIAGTGKLGIGYMDSNLVGITATLTGDPLFTIQFKVLQSTKAFSNVSISLGSGAVANTDGDSITGVQFTSGKASVDAIVSSTKFSVGSAHGKVGDTVTVDIKADYTGSAFNFDVLYDKDVLQPTVLSNGKASVTAMSQLVGPEIAGTGKIGIGYMDSNLVGITATLTGDPLFTIQFKVLQSTKDSSDVSISLGSGAVADTNGDSITGVQFTSATVSVDASTDPVTPPAPNVTRDESTNIVDGMAIGMEYKLDDAAYVAYNAATFAALDFAGNHTLLVRVAAEGANPAGLVTTLTFTTNPVTPAAPSVTSNDVTNTVGGMDVGMEYNLDNAAAYVAYNAATFATLDFAGDHTLLVRVAAEGANPAGLVTTLTFTTNPVTPAAPSVTSNDVTNTVGGMAVGMEYNLDNAAAYVAYNAATFATLDLAGNHTLLVRVAAAGINPAGQITTLTFTTNPVTPAAPAVTSNDVTNTVGGMAVGMEYNLDNAAAYVAYNAATFATLDFAGNHTLLVRVAAAGINPAGQVTTLTFTTNPVTPAAPAVTSNDTTNTVGGMAIGMEYNLDNAVAYVAYNAATFATLDLAGNHTLLVRVAAAGINPAGLVTTLTFTTNTVTTPPAPNVTRDDTLNTVTGMTASMEYKLDSAEYVPYSAAIFNAIDFSGAHTLLVRVAASPSNPVGDAVTLTFTANPAAAFAYLTTTIDSENKVVTLTFNENIVNNTATDLTLKAAITFAPDGITFRALAQNENVNISGKTLVITFPTALEGSANKIRVAASSLKNTSNVVLTTVLEPTFSAFDECFIATAAYGSKNQTDVVLLRQFRDQFLLTNPVGKAFVQTYYTYSPPIAETIAGNVLLKFVTRVLLLPLVVIVYTLIHPIVLGGILLAAMFLFVQRRRRKSALGL